MTAKDNFTVDFAPSDPKAMMDGPDHGIRFIKLVFERVGPDLGSMDEKDFTAWRRVTMLRFLKGF